MCKKELGEKIQERRISMAADEIKVYSTPT
jgi:hypothetical protein